MNSGMAVSQSRWAPERLVGARVVLRRHVPANLAHFKRWYSDPEISRLTRYQDGPMRPDEIDRFFAARVLGADSLTMAVHLRSDDRLIGSCAFSQLDPDNGSALFHITIGEKDCWGRGYGTEATRLMVAYAFDQLSLHRIALSVFAFNERAVRAYRKAGFVVEGRAREAIWRDGRYWDELTMSVLAHEWRGVRHRAPTLLEPASHAGPTSRDDSVNAGAATAVESRSGEARPLART